MKNFTQVVIIIFLCLLSCSIYAQSEDINVRGGSPYIDIPIGDITPSTAEGTDFGNATIGAIGITNTFEIQNTFNGSGGGPSTRLTINSITLSGTHAADFSITNAIGDINKNSSDTFTITFTPSATGTRTATVTIDSDDGDENPWTFAIQGNGVAPPPEINLTGNGNNIVGDGSNVPATTDDTDYGLVGTSSTTTHTFTIENTANPASTLTISDLGTGITITGGSGYFTINTEPAQNSTITGGNSLTFSIDYTPLAVGTHNAVVTIDNDDSDEDPYTFNITGEAEVPDPEIDVLGNSVSIIGDGSNVPTTADHTDFGNVNESGGTMTRTFTIENTGTLALNLTDPSPYITIGGTHAADFTLTVLPTTPIAINGSTTFQITFDPSAILDRTATVSIANSDGDEDPYTFNIKGTGVDICGGYVNTFPYTEDFETDLGQWTQDTGDAYDWTRQTGGTPTASTGPNVANSGSYYIYTEATSNTSNTGNIISPCFDLTGVTNPRFTFYYHFYGSNTGTLNVDLSTDSGVTYPTTIWTNTGEVQTNIASSWIAISIDLSAYIGQTIKLRIQGITGSGDRSDMAIDSISVTTKAEPTIGPGGITNDLALWLKATDGLGYTDGQGVSLWEDQGRGANATVHTAGQEPTYRDNPTHNVNFNPVVDFDNSYSPVPLDGDYSHNDTTTQFLEGTNGYYSQDIFVVIMPDVTINNSFGSMDIYCGDEDRVKNETDATGLGLGAYTARFSGEILSYAHGPTNSGDGYGVAETGTGSTYDNAFIFNVRNNLAATQQELYYNAVDKETTQNDLPDFANVSDTRFWIGRSEGWEASTDARIAEIITYSSRKVDTDLTQERNRIQSYLAVKYGITLGVNGTTQDYVDSDGTVIWDQSANVGYNYDIAGIGRDDASDLNQKQSKSINTFHDGIGESRGLLTIGLTDIYDTNNENISNNATTFTDKQYLTWGNNNGDLNSAPNVVNVDMSAGISGLSTPVTFTGMDRIWKVVENGGDIPTAKVSIPQTAIRNITPPGSYLMFISETGVFDPTADYRVMTSDGNGNLRTDYDFNGTKYITFGYAPEVIVERSVYFDGAVDYIDVENNFDLNPTEFTISAWIKRGTSSANKSILSKRNAAYTEGYDYKITSTGNFEMSWKNGSTQTITSNTVIPQDQWHQVAVIYDGSNAYMYIDGVLDNTQALSAPITNSQDFLIAAADGYDPDTTAHFEGNIDEVRIWDTALTIDELRYIMNQEILDNTNVEGDIMPTSITKNDVSGLPWANLQGYYPMSTYTYTNTKDESGNGRQGALRNLDTVDFQTAPLPYESTQDGNWDTNATWTNGSMQTIPGAASIVDNTITVDWNIVRTTHDVTIDNSGLPAGNSGNRSVMGLFVDSNELTVDGDTSTGDGWGLTVTHYLNLDGTIDLEGESQLIQSTDSDLDITSSGSVERDQQGTADTYTYNYWSSPVSPTGNIVSNNNPYTLPQVFNNGTNPAAPNGITFLGSGYDGNTSGSDISLADYWIWKFADNASNYSEWEHVRSTGSISAGEGFTLKGPGSGAITDDQNYVFQGKPNNGTIQLTVGGGNAYLVGNPYPSAIDANQFILDNSSSIFGEGTTDGTLYFWEHWGGGSHITKEYIGGYGMYSLAGGAPPSISQDIADIHPELGTGAMGSKTPGRYIPVGQGFFIIGSVSGGGTFEFNNGQRIFQKEAGNANSTFMKSGNTKTTAKAASNDERMKIRLGFESVNNYRRQLLLTEDQNATIGIDKLYDAALWDYIPDDMYWLVEQNWYGIQATNNIDEFTVLPLGVHTDKDGLNTITIDELINVPNDLEIFVHDKELGIYHDLKSSDYEVYLTADFYTDRFELTFSSNASLSTTENELNTLQVYYDNAKESIIIHNPKLENISSVEVLNVLGQSISKFNTIESENYLEIKSVQNRGIYIIKLETDIDNTISKKVLIK